MRLKDRVAIVTGGGVVPGNDFGVLFRGVGLRNFDVHPDGRIVLGGLEIILGNLDFVGHNDSLPHS